MRGAEPEARRLRLEVCGQVQGVGFRPFVLREARALRLSGFVRNAPHAVIIEVQGARPGALEARLWAAPAPIQVTGVRAEALPPAPRAQGFSILDSALGEAAQPLVPPDLATCPDCWAEWAGSGRRGGYALLSCTACGPRSSVTRALPLDRARTELAAFPLCPDCQAELEDPADRRFHAQLTACPACGPQVTGLEAAVVALQAGGVIALKGLSGYQLLCRAQDHAAVARLRALKGRPDKPLAALMEGPVTPACPVRIGPMAPGFEHLSDGLPWLGRMAPATPLHRALLMAGGPLVCTSANRTGEAIAGEAESLPPVHAVVDHDRPICRTADDSVLRVGALPPGPGRPEPGDLLLRRGRGLHHPLPLGDGPTVLAFGAHQKATLCLALGRQAILTPYLGTLSRRTVIARYEAEVRRLLTLYGARPQALVCDLHPDYVSSQEALRMAQELELPLLRIPHHEAHVAAVLAEHGHEGPALGFAWDGVGLGEDGLTRGSEALRWDGRRFTRVASLAPFPVAGEGARSPRRCAEGWLGASPWGTPTTSMGRLFDAVAWCCGLTEDTTYEAAAAMKLEAMALPDEPPWPMPLVDGLWRHDHLPALARDPSLSPAARAGRLHSTLTQAIVSLAEGTETIALSGGCFQNALLLGQAVRALEARGHRVLVPRALPPNDEAIAFGQAWLARGRL